MSRRTTFTIRFDQSSQGTVWRPKIDPKRLQLDSVDSDQKKWVRSLIRILKSCAGRTCNFEGKAVPRFIFFNLNNK